MKSQFLKRFEKLNKEVFALRGGRVLIEILPKEEIKSAGGIIMATLDNDHRTFTNQKRGILAVVLHCGQGYYDADGNAVDIDLSPGNIILVRSESLDFYSQLPGLEDAPGETLAMINESAVIASWDNTEAFEVYRKQINS